MPQLLLGLRARMVLALVATAAVTLAVAALTILSPLQQRLRRDTGTTLVIALASTRSSFDELLRERVPSRGLQQLTTALARRTGASATLMSADGQVIAASDADAPAVRADAARALALDRTTRSIHGDELIVASPVHPGHGQYAVVLRKRLTVVRSASHVVRRSALEAAAIGLLVALLLGFGLSTALLRRLRRLRTAVLLAREHGMDAPLPPPDHTRDEIGELSRAFTAMQTELRRQEEARRAFVATASHELRTPVTSLQMGLELLAEDLDSDGFDIDDARQQVRAAHAQTRRLGGLATDLLDLSRLDAAVELRGEPVELGEVALAVTAEFKPRAEGQGSSIPVVLSGPAWASGDPGAAARIVRILVDNALRFSPEGAPVTVTVESHPDGHVTLTVRDEGPGIPDDERDIVFERFRRGARTGESGGFGLGLAIGRELARKMGGELSLEPSDAGAVFTLRLPAGA